MGVDFGGESVISGAGDAVWPFYVVCDVSQSMWDESSRVGLFTPHEVLSDSLAGIYYELLNDDLAAEIGRVGIVTFADDAATHQPLTPLTERVTVDPLPTGGQTNYAQVWKHLNATVREDASGLVQQGLRPKQPVIYFITDGKPYVGKAPQDRKAWFGHYENLCEPSYDFRPRVVALGLGNVDNQTLCALRSEDPPGAACVAAPGAAGGALMEAMIKVIIVSIRNSTGSGRFTFPVPYGMTRLEC